jgi:hypothetical protein
MCHKNGHRAADCLLPVNICFAQRPSQAQNPPFSLCLGHGMVPLSSQSRAMVKAWREVFAKRSETLAQQGKRDNFSLYTNKVVQHHGERLTPTLLESQLKKGIEAHLGMPPLSPFSVNFEFLQSFPHNFLDLNKLKNLPSFLLALDPPDSFSLGSPPPLFP